MSPRSDRGSGGARIAVIGATTPDGSRVRERLAGFGVPGSRVDLYGGSRGEALISEYDGEARLVQEPDPDETGDHDVIFLCVKSFEWYSEIKAGYGITANGFWSFYYTAAGIHAIHVIVGMICMGFVAVQAKRNHELQRVELAGIYWHFVDVVWIFLFPLLYIAK